MAYTAEDVVPQLEKAESLLAEGFWLAGFIAYEAATALDKALRTHPPIPGLPLLLLGAFHPPQRIAGVNKPTVKLRLPQLQAQITADDYTRAFGKILEYEHNGDTYQVNFTFPLTGSFKADAWELFSQLYQLQPESYASYTEFDRWRIVSVSPELFFRLCNDLITVRPMKGTAPRGLSVEEDRRNARRLVQSEKERAENVMIVDMMRNDLTRVCHAGSVKATRLFRRERHPTVWQMISEVQGKTDASFTEILRNLFPCASVTGAPKVRTSAIIRELEAGPRGVYTGAIGYFSPQRHACFNVAIRTALIDTREQTIRYGVGSGVVWDSRSGDEYNECLLKAGVLTRHAVTFNLLETLLYEPQSGWFLVEEHLKRLRQSARFFGFSFKARQVRRALEEAVKGITPAEGPQRVRLLMDKTGHCRTECTPFTQNNVKLHLTLAHAPMDPNMVWHYHKTDNRTMYAAHRAHADASFDDVLLWNPAGEITETTIANIIFKWQGTLYTPPVKCGLLPGVYRAYLLKKGIIREKILTKKMLRKVEGLWTINALRKKIAVHTLTTSEEKITFNF